jgi:hypothetical protein
MNHKLVIPVGLVVLALAIALLIIMGLGPSENLEKPEPEQPVVAEKTPASLPSDFAVDSSAGGNFGLGDELLGRDSSGLPTDGVVKAALAADTSGNEAAREQVLNVIDDAMVTYDVSGLAVLGPMLDHPDPDIRLATIEGIVQLGEASGAKTLRDAARRATDAKERAQMLEAAKFLDLPVYKSSGN